MKRTIYRGVGSILLALASLAVVNTDSFAQSAPNQISPQFVAYIQTEPHVKALLDAIRERLSKTPGACQTGKFERDPTLAFILPIKYDAQGTPIEGAWKESINYIGCDSKTRFNLMTVISPDMGVKVAALLSGTTIATPRLQADSIMYAFMGTALLARGCKEKTVIDTHFDSYTGDAVKDALNGPDSRPWHETWTVWACNQTIDVPISFTPDNRGTGIHSSPSEATLHH